MSRTLRRRLVGVASLLALVAAVVATPAGAAQRVEVIDAPSLAGNIDLAVAKVNKIRRLEARVLLPDGYDEQPDRTWPLLLLLHGIGDDSSRWLDPEKGDGLRTLAGLPAIVVMPESGRGYFTDAWRGGARRGVNWERYLLDEVLPLVQQRYRIAPGREQHTIAGLSMGGYGAELLGAQLPSYFGTVVSFSGLYNIEAPEAQVWVPFFSRFSYTEQWGRWHGPYVRAHNPFRLLPANLRSSRQYISTGNGLAPPDLFSKLPLRIAGGATEWLALIDAERFVRRARALGIETTFRSHTQGLHNWLWWRREMRAAIQWGLFGAPPADRSRFTYATMAPNGNAWGLGFRFAAPPTDQMLLTRDGQRLTATGRGTVTITPGAADGDASGGGTRTDCAFTATLPFTRELPAGC